MSYPVHIHCNKKDKKRQESPLHSSTLWHGRGQARAGQDWAGHYSFTTNLSELQQADQQLHSEYTGVTTNAILQLLMVHSTIHIDIY